MSAKLPRQLARHSNRTLPFGEGQGRVNCAALSGAEEVLSCFPGLTDEEVELAIQRSGSTEELLALSPVGPPHPLLAHHHHQQLAHSETMRSTNHPLFDARYMCT